MSGKILKKNLYGVDLDESAAEIASINLMLKTLRRGEKLPLILEENIKVGNSIVTGVEGKEELLEHKNEIKKMILLREQIKKEENPKIKSELEEEYQRLREKIEDEINENLKDYFKNPKEYKPFNFELEFPEIFYTRDGKLKENGGFDVIVGNPPYVRQEKIKDMKSYLKDQYTCYHGRADLYIYFMERSLKLLKKGGLFSYITSNKYTRAIYGQPLRKWILENYKIREYRDYTGERVFKDATVDPSVIVIEKEKPKDNKIKINEKFNLPQKYLDKKTWTFEKPEIHQIKKKIEEVGKPLKEWNVKIHFGIKTGYNEAFMINTKTKNKILEDCRTKAEKERTKKIIKPVLRGKDIKRHSYNWRGLWMITIPKGWTDSNRGRKDPETFIEESFSSLIRHLRRYREQLEKRSDQGDYWWELRECKYYPEFEKEKIVWQRVTQKPRFSIVPPRFYSEATSHFITGENLRFLLGIFNSSLFEFAFYKFYMGGGIQGEIKGEFIKRFPIPPITNKNKDLAKQIEENVDKILKLKEKEQFTLSSFKRLVENTGQNRFNTSLSQYLKSKNAADYSINLIKTEKLIDDEKMGIPRYYRVKGRKDSIIVSASYSDSQTEDIIQIYFDDPRIKEFFHLAITSQVEGKKKSYRGQKKILETTLEDIKIPRSTRNKEKDRENILGLMQILKEEYEKKFGEDYKRLSRIRERIEEVDKEIDELVYKLYGLSEKERRIVEEGFDD